MEKDRLVLFRKILLENCISFFVSRRNFQYLLKIRSNLLATHFAPSLSYDLLDQIVHA